MKNVTYALMVMVLFFLVACASPKGQTWVVTKARGNHFQNQHTKRWYKLEKGNEAHIGDSLKVVYNSERRFEKIGNASVASAAVPENTVTKNDR